MTTKKFSLKRQREFLDAAKKIAIEAGAVPTPDESYQFVLQTKVGPLRLSFVEGKILAKVFGRFDYPRHALSTIGARNMNAYSGKWNCHAGMDNDASYFAACIGKIKLD